MRCEDIVTEIGSSLAGELEPEAEVRLQDHLAGCGECRAEYERLREVWDALAALPAMAPDTASMQRRFLATLDSFQTGADQVRAKMLGGSPRRAAPWPTWTWAGAMAATLLIGVAIGRGIAGAPAPAPASTDSRCCARSCTTPASSSRSTAAAIVGVRLVRGVSWTGRIDDPGVEVVSALLDALSSDPNVNVRLAAVDALARFADRPVVRSGAVAALTDSGSPMVQIALIDWLVQVKQLASREAMKKLADDQRIDAAVRDRAAWGLQQLG